VNEGLPDWYPLVFTPLSNPQYGPGLTPLMAACVGGRIAVAKLLLENGADVGQTDAKGCTALIHAAVSGQTPALKFLLANGVDVNQRIAYSGTALMWATSRGEMESVKFLLANGANVNAVTIAGFTALNMNCKGPIHDLLKAHGAREYKPASVGTPPLF
jgi:ankyrin repeat protein